MGAIMRLHIPHIRCGLSGLLASSEAISATTGKTLHVQGTSDNKLESPGNYLGVQGILR